MTQTTNDDFIPTYEYATENGISKQNVYRLIREQRFNQEDVRTEQVTVTRLRIRRGAVPTYRNDRGRVRVLGQ